MEDGLATEKRGGQQALVKLPAIVLLAATDAGYERLVDLVSRAYLGGESSQAVHISASWLEEAARKG